MYQLIPSVPTRLLYVDHIMDRGRGFFEVACAYEIEGIVAKRANGRYHSDDTVTNWSKSRMPPALKMTRHELFEHRAKHRVRASVLRGP